MTLSARDFVEAVAGGHVGAIGAAQNGHVLDAERHPFQGLLPRGAEDHHGHCAGAADVHGAGVQRDDVVRQREHGGQLADAGLAR